MNIDWQKIYTDAMAWLIKFGPKILLAVLVFFAGMFVIRFLNKTISTAFTKKKINQSVGFFLQNLLIVAMKVLLVVLCLQIIGIELTILSAIIAGVTVAAGLALSGTLQNFVNGILILLLKPFRVGDEIIADNKEGKVTAVKLFYTEILTGDNITIIFPNGQLSNNMVTNLSKQTKRRINISIKFTYTTDIVAAKKIILGTISGIHEIYDKPAPVAEVSLLETDVFTLNIKAWTNTTGYGKIKNQLNEALIIQLKNAGIGLPERV